MWKWYDLLQKKSGIMYSMWIYLIWNLNVLIIWYSGFSIEGPSQAKIECDDKGDGSCDVRYWPTEAGDYAVHVICDDEDIKDSPFMAHILPAANDVFPEKVIPTHWIIYHMYLYYTYKYKAHQHGNLFRSYSKQNTLKQ